MNVNYSGHQDKMYVFIVIGTPAERIPYQIVEGNQIWSFQLIVGSLCRR